MTNVAVLLLPDRHGLMIPATCTAVLPKNSMLSGHMLQISIILNGIEHRVIIITVFC